MCHEYITAAAPENHQSSSAGARCSRTRSSRSLSSEPRPGSPPRIPAPHSCSLLVDFAHRRKYLHTPALNTTACARVAASTMTCTRYTHFSTTYFIVTTLAAHYKRLIPYTQQNLKQAEGDTIFFSRNHSYFRHFLSSVIDI